MAHEIGPLLKELREAEELTQARLYQNVLSRRQAIRLEAGETDIKAEHLLTVLDRLDMALPEFQYRLQKRQPQVAPPTPQTAMLDTVAAKLNTWLDADMTPGEVRAMENFALGRPFFTVNQIKTLMTIAARLPWDAYDRLTKKLAAQLADMADMPGVQRLRYTLYFNKTMFSLLGGLPDTALRLVPQAQALASDRMDDQIMLQFLQRMAETLVTKDPAAVYAATEGLITHLRGLGLAMTADSLIDNRRHMLSSVNLHPRWTPAELGATARLFAIVPWELKKDRQGYLAKFPGLLAALAAAGQPLSAYRDVY